MSTFTHGSIAEDSEREALKEHLAGLIVENKKLCEQIESLKVTERCINKSKEYAFEELAALRADPAYEFCHRFAVLMQCMVLSGKQDPYWTEASNLLAEYECTIDKWREAMGEPYVSGFGKD
jgi:hypothetical protein